jgi:hypothetical protein
MSIIIFLLHGLACLRAEYQISEPMLFSLCCWAVKPAVMSSDTCPPTNAVRPTLTAAHARLPLMREHQDEHDAIEGQPVSDR